VPASRDHDSEATAKKERLERPQVDLPTYRVSVTRGADHGKFLEIGPSTASALYVGKSSAADLVLTDPEVSRRHLTLDLATDGITITDLDSTNGTTIRGLTIKQVVARGAEVVTLGATDLSIELIAPARAVRFPPVASFGRVLGGSVSMRRLYPLLAKLAASSVPVLIEGETGTGKELLAESLHEMGPNQARPFVVFDGRAVEPKQVDRVLFGEVVDARSGKRRPGVFEEASGGTLVLDEVAELPLLLQAKLLRVLETGEIMPVGGDRWLPISTRVIALTARDLEKAVEHDKFREDLYYRLVVARVSLPPLRHREGDVALLAEDFWRRAKGSGPLPTDLLSAHEDYAWPGNVRELAHVIERRVLYGSAVDVPAASPEGTTPPLDHVFRQVLELDLPLSQARERVVFAFERCYVERAIAKHGGNITRAAAASGLARRYFNVLRSRLRTS
jgi:two-component system, NtrC family, response regulator HydG